MYPALPYASVCYGRSVPLRVSTHFLRGSEQCRSHSGAHLPRTHCGAITQVKDDAKAKKAGTGVAAHEPQPRTAESAEAAAGGLLATYHTPCCMRQLIVQRAT